MPLKQCLLNITNYQKVWKVLQAVLFCFFFFFPAWAREVHVGQKQICGVGSVCDMHGHPVSPDFMKMCYTSQNTDNPSMETQPLAYTPIRHGWQLPLTLNHSSVYQDHSPSCLDPAEWRIRAQSGSRGILGSMLNMGRKRLFIFSQPTGKVLPILYHFRDKPENCCLSYKAFHKNTQ